MPLPATDSVARRVLTSPGVLLFAGLAVVALVAERSLTGSVLSGSATFGGGALVPSYSGAGKPVARVPGRIPRHRHRLGRQHSGVRRGAGRPVHPVRRQAVAGHRRAAARLRTAGRDDGVPRHPAADLRAGRGGSGSRPATRCCRWPPGAVAAGRIGTVVAFVLLPLIGIMAGRVLAGNPRTATRAAWAAGLLTAVTAAFVPLAWPVAVIAAVAATAAWSWLGPRTVINAWIVAVVPGVLLIPWTFHLVISPSAFFAEAGPGPARARRRSSAARLAAAAQPGRTRAAAGLGHRRPRAARVRRAAHPPPQRPGVRRMGCRAGRPDPGPGGEPGHDHAASRAAPRSVPGPAWPSRSPRPGCCWRPPPLIEAIGRALGGQTAGGRADPDRSGPGWRFAASVVGLAAVVSAPALAAGGTGWPTGSAAR